MGKGINIEQTKIYQSQFREQVIKWMKEGMTTNWIQTELKKQGMKISLVSILNFKKALTENEGVTYLRQRIKEYDNVFDILDDHRKKIELQEERIARFRKLEEDGDLKVGFALNKAIETYNSLASTHIKMVQIAKSLSSKSSEKEVNDELERIRKDMIHGKKK